MIMEMVTFTLEKKDKAALKRCASVRGLSLSSLIRTVLRDFVDREKLRRSGP